MIPPKLIAIVMLAIAAALAAAPIVNACEGDRVLLEDNFQRFSQRWGYPDQFHTIGNGKFTIAPALNRSYMASIDPPRQGLVDMDACVDVVLAQGGPQMTHTYGGLAFWVSHYNEFYELIIGPSGAFGVDLRLPDRRVMIVNFNPSTVVKSGVNQVNRLRVKIRGNSATLYINGVQVANITGQPPPRGGYVGLTAQSGPNTRDVYEFTNFKVTN
jgi:hypothetical protein